MRVGVQAYTDKVDRKKLSVRCGRQTKVGKVSVQVGYSGTQGWCDFVWLDDFHYAEGRRRS